MTTLAARLIVPLARYAAAIAGSADKQSVKFVESTWRSWLSRAHVEPAVTDRVFRAIGTDAVTRPQIRRLAEDAETADLRLALLIAALVWGRGKKNGRMRDSIIKTLTHDDRDRVLERTAELAQDDNIPAAYRAWTLPGLRQPFFTKWLWAATSLAPEKCCLVLDRRVRRSLEALRWSSLEAAGNRRNWDVRYAAYVEDMHICADKLGEGVTAEDVEYILFRMNGDPGRLDELDRQRIDASTALPPARVV